MKSRKGFATIGMVVLVYIALLIFGVIGWGMNVYKLVQCDFEAPIKAEVIRGIGIVVVPVGAIAGYCDISDGKEED
jgi:predicted tellurium resistance membrane protein TerC